MVACVVSVWSRGLWSVAALALGIACCAALAETRGASAGSANIGGMRLSCAAAKVVVSNAVPGPGFAVQGLIMFGPKFLNKYPQIVQRLVFLHECGHQYVGTDESSADCWAVRSGKRQGWLTPAGLKQACRALWHTEADGAHLAGPERCDALKQCFETAPGRKG